MEDLLVWEPEKQKENAQSINIAPQETTSLTSMLKGQVFWKTQSNCFCFFVVK
jgi:hypothetical protein